MSSSKITAYGELLVDLIAEEDEDTLIRRAGGAPANMAAGCALLGHDTDLISCVGEDAFGDFLLEAMDEVGVDTGQVQRSDLRTTLAVTALDRDGEPSFTFYRDANADTEISQADIDQGQLRDTDHLHCGSLSLTTDPVRSTLFTILEETTAQVSFDPNLREDLLTDELLDHIDTALDHVDILLCAEDELDMLAPGTTISEQAGAVIEEHGIHEVIVTHGADGASIYTADDTVTVSAVETEVVDTTGAGDAFTAGYVTARLEGLDPGAAGERGARTAAHCVQEKGAIEALPTRGQLEGPL